MLAGKGINRAGDGMIRASYRSLIKIKCLIPPHLLTNFEIQKYQNEPRFTGVYSRDNLPKKIKDGAYVTNLHEKSHTGTHWINLYPINDVIFFQTVLELTIFQEKLKNSLMDLPSQKKFIEYKHVIQ